MKILFALAAVIATGVLLTTGCSTCCKDGSCAKPTASLCPGDGSGCTNKLILDLASCPGCPSGTNKLNLASCPGCTNKLALDFAACPKDCTNKLTLDLAA